MPKKQNKVTLSEEATKELIETCPSCLQIYKTAVKIKTKHPHMNDLDIVGSILEAVGDGPMGLIPDEELLKEVEDDYLRKQGS